MTRFDAVRIATDGTVVAQIVGAQGSVFRVRKKAPKSAYHFGDQAGWDFYETRSGRLIAVQKETGPVPKDRPTPTASTAVIGEDHLTRGPAAEFCPGFPFYDPPDYDE